MNVKDFLIDKTVKVGMGAFKSGKIIVNTSKEIVQTTGEHAQSMIINYSPDIQDEHSDLSAGATKFFGGKALMTKRTASRLIRSGRNVYHRKKSGIFASKASAAENRYQTSLKQYDRIKNTLTPQEMRQWNQRLNIQKNNIKRFQRKAENQAGKINLQKGFSMKRSVKNTVSNQTRRLISRIGAEDDLGSRTVSSAAMSAWSVNRYRKSAVGAIKKTVYVAKSIVSGVISFVASIPAILVAIVTSLPLMIIVIFTVSILAFFGANLEFSGRVLTFSENEVKLENAYQTALIPDEILAITQTLGWTTQNIEDYEVLISLAYDQERGSRPTFEEMLENIFDKYNPAMNLSNGSPIDYDASSGFIYYHNDEASIWNLGNSSVRQQDVTNQQWLDIYPEYRDGSTEKRDEMETQEYVNRMKEQCRSILEENGYNYVNAFLQIDSEPNLFTAYVIQPESASFSSAVGYRHITINDREVKSFHEGVDIPAVQNTPVYAAMDGLVVYADGSQTIEGESTGLWGAGNSVIIRKDLFDAKGNPCYLYVMTAHLEPDSVRVHQGDRVSAGTQIAGVGTTGISTGYHLHFQVWISTKKIDEMTESDYETVSPASYTDSETGYAYGVDSDSYTIFLDGLMFYDVGYRNALLDR